MCGVQVGQEISTIRLLCEAWLIRMAREVGTPANGFPLKKS